MQKLPHKHNHFSLDISGNFKDSADSMFYIHASECWHVTFVKISKNRIEEHLRKVIVLDGLDDFYLSEVEFTYCSDFESVRAYRAFLRKQESFLNHEGFLKIYFQKIEKDKQRLLDFGDDVPF